nr:tyrosine-type recombinase/integrase [Nocardiopsis valliformis]
MHDLRHSAATYALGVGMNLKTLQAMLGHASIVLTADTYTSVLPEVTHKAAEATAALALRDTRSAPCALTPREAEGPRRVSFGSHHGNARRGSAIVVPGERC